ncbi:serine/threonine protein kinase [Natronolimnobius baerhuensis]|uniref:Protein kinase domain-containing protein n=1 Tax=Natronolimnobius baerhuensis TaxID=253108 RepID=A0A202E3N6_9EURY|nr:serine/threonine-protein kinase [Natronolimnobius baerhuensis]OVE82824.1 hypothetical protein B2G88_18700 [Natronolimnobius baerhuensis]
MSSGVHKDLRPDVADTDPVRIDADFTDFEELEAIGSGGNADVTKVQFKGEGPDICALKQPRMQGTLDVESLSQFTAEAETWEKLDDHDHIVSVLGYESQPLPWIALEYMDGGSLDARLGDLEPAEALWIGVCIARAVRHAHRRGIAHLDLKPENVLFAETEPGSWDVPKVADWGLAKMLLEHSQSIEGLSPHYAAPEQFDDETYGHTDDYTDIYATGAVVYAALVGEPPFTGSAATVMHDVLESEPIPPSERVDGLPEGTDSALMRALTKDKSDRYESILDFKRELNRLLELALGNDPAESMAAPRSTPSQNTSDSTSASTSTQRGTVSSTDQAGTNSGTTITNPGDPSVSNNDKETDRRDTTRPNTGADTGVEQPNSRSTSESPSQQSPTEPTPAQRVSSAVIETDFGTLHTHHILYGSFPAFILGGASGTDGGAVIILGSIIGFFYAWNKEMVLFQQSERIEWSPRRYLYYIGLIAYALTFLLYLYRRRKAVGLFGTIEP